MVLSPLVLVLTLDAVSFLPDRLHLVFGEFADHQKFEGIRNVSWHGRRNAINVFAQSSCAIPNHTDTTICAVLIDYRFESSISNVYDITYPEIRSDDGAAKPPRYFSQFFS